MQIVMLDPGNYTPYYVGNLCRCLEDLGLEVEVVTSAPLFEPVAPAGRYQVRHLFYRFFEVWPGQTRLFRDHAWLRQATKGLIYPRGLWRVWSCLKDRPSGVLHSQWALVPTLDRLLFRALRRRGWRVVHTVHDLPLPATRWKTARWRGFYQQTDAVIVHTCGLAETLKAHFGDSLKQVHVAPIGDSGAYGGPVLSKTDARRALGLACGEPLLLFFGLIKPYKGLEYLVGAMPPVLRDFPDVKLLIAGKPMERFDRYQRLIDQLGVRNAVILRLHFIPQREVVSYFSAADIIVLPYTRVSQSGVLPAGLGCGRPVVVTAVGGLPELVENGRTGFIVPPQSAPALAQAILQALGDPTMLETMSSEALRQSEKRCSWTEAARQTLHTYRSVTDTGRSGAT